MQKSMFALLLAFTAGLAVQLPARVLAGPAEDVQVTMQLLKAKSATLGAPSVKGEDAVAGKVVPALYFGETKMNNNFALVDEVRPIAARPARRDGTVDTLSRPASVRSGFTPGRMSSGRRLA